MRRQLQALTCRGTLLALSSVPATPAAAARACRVVAAKLRCSATPRRYYVEALDYRGGQSTSGSVLLSCENRPAAGGASSAGTEVVRLTNRARTAGGCRPRTHDPKLRRTSPGGRSAGDRIRSAGFAPVRPWGENIGVGHHAKGPHRTQVFAAH